MTFTILAKLNLVMYVHAIHEELALVKFYIRYNNRNIDMVVQF